MDRQLTMRALLPLLTLSLLPSLTAAFKCPASGGCRCIEESVGEYRILCGEFEVTVQRSDRLKIECTIPTNWSSFLGNSSLELGEINTLVFSRCQPPSTNDDPRRIAQLLGVTDVERIFFKYIDGRPTGRDLEPYPELRRLSLADNDLRELSPDFLRYSPRIELLDLRNTKVQIPDGFFNNSKSLLHLELGNNRIKLRPGMFDGLTNLKLLNLWNNNFVTIESGVLRNLTNLNSVDLHQNNLKTLPADLLHDLPNLKIVNLISNNFSSLPEGLFERNKQLQIFKFNFNKRNLTSLPAGFLANLEELQTVTLTRIGLQSLPEDLFANSSRITNLSIDRNYLTTLPSKIFRDFRELKYLSLSFNDLEFLSNGIFRHLTKLQKLDLSKNKIKKLSDRALMGLSSLFSLNMESNHLSFIHPDAFSQLDSLQIARFAWNNLTLSTNLYDDFFQGELSPFRYCHALEELYLAHNNISEMFSDWVISNVRLRKLDLKYNSFYYLQAADLQFVSGEVEVDLRYNNIAHIYLSQLQFMAINQSQPRNVIVDIEGNPIRCDCHIYDFLRYIHGDMHPTVQNYVHIRRDNVFCSEPDYKNIPVAFLRPDQLRCRLDDDLQHPPGDPCGSAGYCDCWYRPHDRALVLDCSGRNLTRAPPFIMAQNASRVELHLQSNWLREPPVMINPGYSKVAVLDLSNNRISSVSKPLISPNLEQLRLNGNNLSHVSQQVLETWTHSEKLRHLELQNNPWRCDCDSVDLLYFVQSKVSRMPELREVTCSGANKSLAVVFVDELCPSYRRMTVMISLGLSAFCLLLAAFVALYYRYRQHIKVWLYAKNLCFWWVSEEEVDRDKIYDVFISYSHDDEEFVVKELVSRLEDGPFPYKVCIHIRDWLAGELIPAQIARSVEESRRTLVVLSNNFVRSEWGQMEFQTAHAQTLNEKRSRLIVVVLGELDDKLDLYPELKAYLQTNTYIKWGDPWFWRKLRYSLPHRVQYTPRVLQPTKSAPPSGKIVCIQDEYRKMGGLYCEKVI